MSLNAFGAAAIVRRAVRQVARSVAWEQYPDPTSLLARRAVAARWERPLREILCGAGASELITAACAAFLTGVPKAVALVPRYAFGEYARAALLAGARIATVGRVSRTLDALADGASADEWCRAVERTKAQLAFLCTPGNPVGRQWSRDELRMVADCCRRTGTLLVLDQAYDAFCREPLGMPALAGHAAVLHLRSLTKEHALAGLRAAVATAAARIIGALDAARTPWTVSVPAQAAIIAAMSDGADSHVARTTRRLRRETARIRIALQCMGVATAPTSTHILAIEVGSATRVRDALLRRDAIKVRDCTSFSLPTFVRIGARTPAENDLLLAALARLVRRGVIPTATVSAS